MEWLAGALVGGLIALTSALIATEYRTWRQRRVRRADLAGSLSTEVAANQQRLRTAVVKMEERADDTRMAGPPFARTVFNGCVRDLALLPRDTREAVVQFYSRLDTLDFWVNEWRTWQLSGRHSELSEEAVKKTTSHIVNRLRTGVRDALDRAEKALSKLNSPQGL